MKHTPFTKDLAEKLLNEGYTYLVISDQMDKDGLREADAILTLEPIRDLPKNKALPIKQMMALPEDKLRKIYVLFKDEQKPT